MTAKPDEEVIEEEWTPSDEIVSMRFARLVKAGFDPRSALELASAFPRVDLHKAEDLAVKAGPEMAYKILA